MRGDPAGTERESERYEDKTQSETHVFPVAVIDVGRSSKVCGTTRIFCVDENRGLLGNMNRQGHMDRKQWKEYKCPIANGKLVLRTKKTGTRRSNTTMERQMSKTCHLRAWDALGASAIERHSWTTCKY